MQDGNFNRIAESIIYKFLTDPTIDSRRKSLETTSMTCSICHTKGLIQSSEPRTIQHSFAGVVRDVELIDYVCPYCGQEWQKFSHSHGGGIIEKELSPFEN